MRSIDFTSARLFLAIVEEGSIARAAAREHIVPSAVSRRLAELEDLFSVELVERSRNGIRLTPAGEAFTHHARMVQQAIERMHDEMSEYLKGVRGHIRVRVSASSLSVGLPSQLQSFMRLHKRVRLDLQEMDTPDVFREVRQGRADVGIAPNLVDNEELELFPYHRYDLAVALPARHPLAKHKSLRYAQVLRYDQVELQPGAALSALLDSAAAQSSLVKRTRIRVHGFEGVCHMIASGMGIGVIPLLLQQTREQSYGLKFVPLAESWAHPLICVVVRKLEDLPGPARALVQHLGVAAAA
ncbi:LysR family transcriptional regulator [Pseudorhodoferax sp.]|uniref:LysR family transcriptional regulator n=1 Tax=Pseudorhodoferax sp. TaxID=1993553 RepID=UPI002DD6555B|nr:LysR family transcriptional regulator [Pseudorhodoferax sp.]